MSTTTQQVTFVSNTVSSLNNIKAMAESVDYVHPTLSAKGVIMELTGFKGQVEIALNTISGIVESYGVVTLGVSYICETMLEIL